MSNYFTHSVKNLARWFCTFIPGDKSDFQD